MVHIRLEPAADTTHDAALSSLSDGITVQLLDSIQCGSR